MRNKNKGKFKRKCQWKTVHNIRKFFDTLYVMDLFSNISVETNWKQTRVFYYSLIAFQATVLTISYRNRDGLGLISSTFFGKATSAFLRTIGKIKYIYLIMTKRLIKWYDGCLSRTFQANNAIITMFITTSLDLILWF